MQVNNPNQNDNYRNLLNLLKVSQNHEGEEFMSSVIEDGHENRLSEYKKLLEVDRLKRKLRNESKRASLEACLQEENEKILSSIREELILRQRREMEEIESKKRLLFLQKEESERQHQLAINEIQKQEKNRILSEFERESEATEKAKSDKRNSTRTKLQNRLMAKTGGKKPRSDDMYKIKSDIDVLGTNVDLLTSQAGHTTELLSYPSVFVPESSDDILNGMKLRERTTFSSKPIHHSKDDVRGLPGSGNIKDLVRSFHVIEAKLDKIYDTISNLQLKNSPKRRCGANTIDTNFKTIVQQFDLQDNSERDRNNNPVAMQGVSSSYYQDMDDPAPGNKLTPVDNKELDDGQLTSLSIAIQLSQRIGLNSLIIKTAKSLPPSSSLSSNVYRNSYIYIENIHTLFIHAQRLHMPGDIGLVTIHALSHIKVSTLKSQSYHRHHLHFNSFI